MKCDATQSPQEVRCQYTKTIGTNWEDEVKKQFDISARVSAEIQGHFFKLFSAGIGVSVNTGYDWTHISIETMSEEVSVEVNMTLQSLRQLMHIFHLNIRLNRVLSQVKF